MSSGPVLLLEIDGALMLVAGGLVKFCPAFVLGSAVGLGSAVELEPAAVQLAKSS